MTYLREMEIVDVDTGSPLKINDNGSIDVNAELGSGLVTIKDAVSGETAIVDSDGNLHVKNEKYPDAQNAVHSNSTTLHITNFGGINSKTYSPQVIVEGAPEGTDEIVTATTTAKYLQVFRLDSNNIKDIIGSFKTNPLTSLIDNFDSGVTSNWISDSGNITVSAESNIVYEGTGSMRVRTRNNNAVGDSVNRTFGTAQDLSDIFSLNFHYRTEDNQVIWSMIVEDDTGKQSKSVDFSAPTNNNWAEINLVKDSFTDLQVNSTDWSNIKKIIWYCEVTHGKNDDHYFDILNSYTEVSTGNISISYYDFGTNANPTSLSQGTLLTSDDGNTIMSGDFNAPVRTKGEMDFTIGVKSGNEITPGNYYGVYIELTNITIYGSNTQTYQSGKFYSVDNSNNLIDENKTLYFGIYSVPSEWSIKHFHFRANAIGKETEIYVTSLDSNGSVHESEISDLKFVAETNLVFQIEDETILHKDDILRLTAFHDVNSDVTYISFNLEFSYKNFVRYG